MFGGFFVCFSQNHCVFSSVYVVLSVVFYPIGFVLFFVPVQSISTSGMSITFLNKQNVSRYYAPPPQQTTPSRHCLQDAERVSISHVRISLLKPRL